VPEFDTVRVATAIDATLPKLIVDALGDEKIGEGAAEHTSANSTLG